jgi:uncharacterized protein (TIGR03067 family)
MCALVLLLALPAAEPTKEEAAKKQLEKLQGTWRCVSIELDGKVAEFKQEVPNFNLVVNGTKFTFGKSEGELSFNPLATPPAIDLRYAKPEEATVVGIYNLDEDTLTLCLKRGKGEAKDRPTEFATKGKPEVEIRTYKYVKPKK